MEEGQFSLIKELSQGKELATLLCNHIASSSSHETNEALIEKILSSYDKALKMLTNGENVADANPAINADGSSRCEEDHNYKKRKMMPRWSEQVKVCSRTGIENSLDDGYSWRKYGQKDILGAKFPRGYYRCTHRFLQGCEATKQVQRSDEDPTIYEVTYRGQHTCNNQAYFSKAAPSSSSSKKNKMMGSGETTHQKLVERNHHQSLEDEEEEEEKIEQSLVTFFNFEPEGGVKMEDIFPTTASDNYYYQLGEIGSADFISPSTSESNLFGLSSPCHMGSAGSEVTDIVSAPTSVTNSPFVDLDALFDKQDFQSATFPFNTSEFFSS